MAQLLEPKSVLVEIARQIVTREPEPSVAALQHEESGALAFQVLDRLAFRVILSPQERVVPCSQFEAQRQVRAAGHFIATTFGYDRLFGGVEPRGKTQQVTLR